jgi:hypothetical protein
MRNIDMTPTPVRVLGSLAAEPEDRQGPGGGCQLAKVLCPNRRVVIAQT